MSFANGVTRAAQRKQLAGRATFRRNQTYAAAMMALLPLEPRELLSVSATTLAGPLITGSTYTYQTYFLGQVDGGLTNTVVGPTTFNNTQVTEIDQTLGNEVTQNYYAFDSAGDFVSMGSVQGTETIKTDSGQTGTVYPATMTAGQTYTTSYTETETTQYGSGPQTVSDSFSLGNTTSVSVPLGTFPVVEVDDSHTVVNGDDTEVTNYQYYFNPAIGLVEYSEVSPNEGGIYAGIPAYYELSSVTGLGSLIQTPTNLTIDQQPSTAAANATLSPLVVDVKDANGTLVSTDNSNVTLTLSAGNGTLGGTLTEQAVGGVATFSDLTISSAGNYTITASDGNLTAATSTNIRITGGAAVGGTGDLTVAITKSTLPASVVAGGTAKGTVTLDVSNVGNATTSGTVKLYATADGTVDGSSILLGTGKAVTVKGGKTSAASVTIKSLPGSLDGNYQLIATVTDTAGDVSTSAVGPALTAAAPAIAFTETLTAVSGLSTSTPAISGQKTKAAVKLTIANDGNIASSGKSTVAVYASTDNTVANGTLIVSESVPVVIKPGANHPLSVSLKNLPSLPDESYHLVVQVTDGKGDVTTVASSAAYPLHAPFESLVPTAASLKTAKNGTGTLNFTVTNQGNVASQGTNTASLLLSSTESLANATTLGSENSSVVIKPGKPHTFSVKLTAIQVTDLESATLTAVEITDATGTSQTLDFTA